MVQKSSRPMTITIQHPPDPARDGASGSSTKAKGGAKGKKGEKVRSSCATHAPVRVRNCLPATLPH